MAHAQTDEVAEIVYKILLETHNSNNENLFWQAMKQGNCDAITIKFALEKFIQDFGIYPFDGPHTALPAPIKEQSDPIATKPPRPIVRANPSAIKKPSEEPKESTFSEAEIWDMVGHEIERISVAYGHIIYYHYHHIAPRVAQLFFDLGASVRVNQIRNLIEEFQANIQLQIPLVNLVVHPHIGKLLVQTARHYWEPFYFQDWIFKKAGNSGKPIQVPWGVGNDRKLVRFPLSSTTICGATGSGKTSLLRAVTLALMVENSPTQLRFRFASLSGATFRYLNHSPWVKDRTVATTVDAYEAFLDAALEEIAQRESQFLEKELDDIWSYNQFNPDCSLACEILIADEITDVTDCDPKTIKRIRQRESAIARKGRRYGVYLWLSAHRADKRQNGILDPLFVSNAHTRVLLACDEASSRLLIEGEDLGAKLGGKGDAYVQYLNPTNRRRIQALTVSQEYIHALVLDFSS